MFRNNHEKTIYLYKMTASSIDIYQKLSDFKKSYDDAYNKTSAIFNNHVKADEPSIRMNNNSNNPNIEIQPVKPNPVKIDTATTPNSRIWCCLSIYFDIFSFWRN